MTKKEKQQLEMFKADVGWFHIFKELIRNKTWEKLSLSSAKLYPVIKSFINHQNGSAFPSIDALEEYSGLSRASVIKALKELEAKGLLTKTTSGRNSNYAIVEKFDVKDEHGQSKASVSFDYMPAYVKDAVAELKNFVAEGLTTPDGKVNYIRIDNLTLNIFQPDSQQINNDNRKNIEVQPMVMPKEAIKGIKDVLAHQDTEEARLMLGKAKKSQDECG